MHDERSARDPLITCLYAVPFAAAALALYSLACGQPLNWDEIEFYRASDFVRHGLVPYRDFWEHHAPLQWLLFAPATALTSSPGAISVLVMRTVQLPVWITTLVLLMQWMREAPIDRTARWTALAFLVVNGPFLFQAIEFRIDALSSLFFVAALFLALHIERSRWHALACGALLCLAGFANLRVMPLALAAGGLLLVTSPSQSRWGGSLRRLWIAAGGATVVVAAAVWFTLTTSAAQAWQYAVVDNVLAERFVVSMPGRTARMLLNVAGVGLANGVIPFRSPFLDIGAIVVWTGGIAGCIIASRRWRRPDPIVFLTILAIIDVVLTVRVKLAYHYHFGLATLLMVPLSASAIARLPGRVSFRRVVCGVVLVALALTAVRTLFLGGDVDLRYQDFMMREAHRRSSPGDVVLDPVGWAIRRRPAYRYWFVPSLVRILVSIHRMEPYRVVEAVRMPPALVLANERTLYWFSDSRPLQEFITAHYAPLWPNLWVPAPNGVVPAHGTLQWAVPRQGNYAIYASPVLAKHPWFRDPLSVLRGPADGLQIELQRFGAPALPSLRWRLDGIEISIARPALSLRKGQRLEVSSSADVPIGLFLVDEREGQLFRSTNGASLDGVTQPRFHRPWGSGV